MLNQKELVNRIRTTTGYKYNLKDIDSIVSAMTSIIIESVSTGEDVYIKELGKFYPKFVKGKEINNAGIPWLAGKNFIVKDRFKLGFSPNKLASKKVESLIVTIKEYASNDK